MIRLLPAAAAILALATAPALAQTTRPQAPVQKPAAPTTPAAPAANPAPGSDEWLRLRGETYSDAPDAEQDPAELAETMRLNAEIAARNDAAERREMEGAAAWQAEDARWRAEVARLETERAQWEADAAVAEAARQRYERDRAAWEAEVAACENSGRVCIKAPPRP
ncbi:MAG: cell wall hydrolase [Brevundimonas sp.]